MTRGPYRARPSPGSFSELIAAFRQSPRFRDYAPSTRAAVDRFLGRFNLENGRHQVSSITRGLIIALRDSMADAPGAANNWLSHLRTLLDYAVDLEYIAHNPARDVGPLKPKRLGGYRTWREDEIDAYLAHWGPGAEARLVLLLALYTGAAAVDLVKLGWHSVSDGRIRYRRQKTERRKGTEETPLVDVPILPPLAEELERTPRDRMTFINRSPGSLGHALRLWCEKAGLGAPDAKGRHLTLHGLRKAMGRRLAEAGASTHMIASVLGHESVATVETYTKAYDRRVAADSALGMLDGVKPGNVTRLRRTE